MCDCTSECCATEFVCYFLRGSLLVKGAAEFVLRRCTTILLEGQGVVRLDQTYRDEIEHQIRTLGFRGLRVLAFAYKSMDSLDLKGVVPSDYVKVEQDLVFIGMVGIIDPPRPQVTLSHAKTFSRELQHVLVHITARTPVVLALFSLHTRGISA